MSDPINIPIVIIGGGGCGLTLSSLLSDYGIEHYLFERHPGTSILPKAHYLNQRSMEILRQHDLVDEIIEKGSPLRNISRACWKSSLGGDGPLDRQTFHQIPSFGGDDGTEYSEAYRRDAPLRSGNLPLVRLEPIMRKNAEKRNPGKVLFGHNVTDFVDEGNSVLVTVQDKDGKESKYRCQYLVGADGGKTVGPKIGVELEGAKGIADMVSTYFSADLSEYWDDRNFACHFINGQGGTVLESGAIVPMGPTWGRHSEEWVFHFGFDLEDEHRFEEAKLVPRIRDLLKLPDLDMKVHKVSHWILERVLANKYGQGRIFVAGDAAHRHPPTTGLGLNTGIEDALNLAWKLAVVVDGKAAPSILDGYETERRFVGKRNCDWGLFTFTNTTVIGAAVGLVPGQTEANQLRFKALFEDSDTGRTFRAQVRRIIESQSVEFSAHDLELGFRYENGFLIPDGTETPEADPLGQVYVPRSRPGHRLPHAWIELDRKELSTHDLVGRKAAFVLITDAEGKDWVSSAEKIAKARGIDIATAQIGQGGKYRDHDDQWEKVKGIKTGGALLVRPDNIVAWRSIKPSQKQGEELVEAVNELLQSKKGIAV